MTKCPGNRPLLCGYAWTVASFIMKRIPIDAAIFAKPSSYPFCHCLRHFIRKLANGQYATHSDQSYFRIGFENMTACSSNQSLISLLSVPFIDKTLGMFALSFVLSLKKGVLSVKVLTNITDRKVALNRLPESHSEWTGKNPPFSHHRNAHQS